jgi:hypothetical protein
MLDFDRIRTARLRTDPYPYAVVENALLEQEVAAVAADFPAIRHPGSIPLSEVNYGAKFAAMLSALDSDEFRQLIADKFGIDLKNRPSLYTLRGIMREKDGRIHTDSKTKVITVLLYFNVNWQHEGGRLRVLRNGEDMDDYVEEIAPEAGTMMIFQVTDNCWHGHKPVVGKRLSLQMYYLVGELAKGRHQFVHGLSAKVKKLFS